MPQVKISMQYSRWVHMSYGLGGFLDNFLTGAFSLHVFFFYEDELHIPGLPFMLAAYILYGLWNIVNDPIAGYISDRPFRWVRRWGRRFPLFLLMALPYAVAYLFIFLPPGARAGMDAWAAFPWLLATICIFDWCYSFWQTNWMALFSDKFRDHAERTKVGACSTYAGQVGIAFGMLLPSLFITYGDIMSYFFSAAVVAGIGLAIALLMIPGMREDTSLKERESKNVQRGGERFLTAFKFAIFHNHNFIAYVLVYLAQMVLFTLALGSLDYWVKYIIPGGTTDDATIIAAGLLVGGLVSTPLWARVGRTRGNRIGYLYGAVGTIVALVPFMFASGIIDTTLAALFLGFCIGSGWTLMYPALADVIDEIVVRTGKRNEGIYTGIRTIFGRVPVVIEAVAFSVIHALTGYAQDPFSPLAQFGYRVHTALIPLLFYFVGVLMMWKVYDLTPAKVAQVRIELSQKNL